MKFSPLECGYCGKPIIVGQMAQWLEEDDYGYVIHSANKEEFADPKDKKRRTIKTSCMEAKKRGLI